MYGVVVFEPVGLIVNSGGQRPPSGLGQVTTP